MRGEQGDKLTERELEVLAGIASGLMNSEIAKTMFVSENTVKTHARRMFRKLGARDRAHAVALGHSVGLLGGRACRLDDTARIGAAHACLDKWRPERNVAPDESRFARLYDGLAQVLAARPDPPS